LLHAPHGVPGRRAVVEPDLHLPVDPGQRVRLPDAVAAARRPARGRSPALDALELSRSSDVRVGRAAEVKRPRNRGHVQEQVEESGPYQQATGVDGPAAPSALPAKESGIGGYPAGTGSGGSRGSSAAPKELPRGTTLIWRASRSG